MIQGITGHIKADVFMPASLNLRKASILSSVSSTHLITAVVVAVMSLLVIAGLRFRQKRKTFIVISWYALALIGLYIFGAYALFTSGIGSG